MREWIAKLLFRFGGMVSPVPADPLENLPCLKTHVRDDLRLRVFHNRKRCGHLGCVIQISVLNRDDDSWMELVFLSSEDLHTALWLLNQAAQVIDNVQTCAPEPALVDD